LACPDASGRSFVSVRGGFALLAPRPDDPAPRKLSSSEALRWLVAFSGSYANLWGGRGLGRSLGRRLGRPALSRLRAGFPFPPSGKRYDVRWSPL